MSGWGRIWIGVLVVLVVTAWASTLWWLPYVHDRYFVSQSRPSGLVSYGAIGDIFGAANALFSGLALGFISLTIWLDTRNRKHSRKPLVLGGIVSGDVLLECPRSTPSGVVLPMHLPLKLSNQSNDAALNVSGKLGLVIGGRPSWEEGIDGPLINGADAEVAFNAQLARRDWMPMLDALTALQDVEIEVVTRYRSLEGVNWKTVVRYQLFVRQSDQLFGLLNVIRDGSWDQAGVWPQGALVPVSTRVKRGSWDHMSC